MSAAAPETLEVRVANLDCENEAAAIRRRMEGAPGLLALEIFPRSAKVILRYDPKRTDPRALKEGLAEVGFPVQQGLALPEPPRPWRNPKMITSVVSGSLLGLGWLLGCSSSPDRVSQVLFLLALTIGGYYFARESLEALIYQRRVGIELLMSVAAVVAAAMGQAAEGAMLVFLYSLSEAAETYTEDKTRSAIRALMELTPKRALVRRDGREVEVPAESLRVEEVFIVRAGEAVATDGEVVAGESAVNQAPVTGESVPVEKRPGDTLFAGSVNGQGALEVRVIRPFADNTIHRIIRMVEDAQERKGRRQRFIERFGERYSPAVLGVGVLLALLPPIAFGAPWEIWIGRATVFVVAAAPCALVISIPVTFVAALGTAARSGVLFKGGVYLEELAQVTVVALDKTGTLTRGEPQVTDVVPDLDRSADDLLAAAAGVEARSQHPLARAILDHARSQGIDPVQAGNFQARTGLGASALIGGRRVFVGSPTLFEGELGITLEGLRGSLERLETEGKTVVVVGDERGGWGLIALQDSLRENARQAVEAMRREGVRRVVMLTGDHQATAEAIARELGVDEVHAELKPQDKLERVRQLTERHGHVAMVGDGVNDAPALAQASVGVAMGAAGSDVALETADVALMADDLEKLAYALRLARRTHSVVRQNLVLSALVIGALVAGALAGAFSLPVAVMGHELSEFVVIGSGLRMLRG